MSCAPTVSGQPDAPSAPATSSVLDAQGADSWASTTDFDLYAFTVPANTVIATSLLKLSIDGFVQNGFNSRAFGIEVSAQGVVLYSGSMTSIAANAVPRAWSHTYWLRSPTLATATLRGMHRLSGAAASAVGFPALGTAMANDAEISSTQPTPAVDWTSDALIRVRITPDLANAAYIFGRHGATLELLSPA